MIEQSFDPLMPDYRHDRILDETYFFTVNLLERRMDLPNAYIGVLREGASDAVHFVHHILREFEDFALDEAIREGLETERIMREEVFSIFQGRA
jgi:hypothetical protein